jgi:hypothetical protein
MKKAKPLTFVIFVILVLSSCTSPTPKITPSDLITPNDFTETYEPLTCSMADFLMEIDLLEPPTPSAPLLKTGYLHDDNVVVGIYGHEGTIIGWNLDEHQIAFVHKLGIVTSKSLMLLSSGKYLIGATQNTFKPDGNHDVEYVNGVALWDVQSGALIRCITYPCQDRGIQNEGFLGLTTDSSGQWLAIFSENGIGISSVFGGAPSLYLQPVALDSAYHWRIGSIAFDERNRRFAVVFQEGRVYLYEGERTHQYSVVAKGAEGNRLVVTDTQIDPTGQWLVMARGNRTQVLNLDNGKPLLEIAVSNPVLTFDRTGELLFVGSANKMTIYSIEEAEKIAEYDAVGITSLFISQDDRLVIWGDIQGVIHVWARVAE